MKQLVHINSILILVAGLIACDRIQSKTEQVVDKVKEKTKEALQEQSQKVVDKVFPSFDHDQADTDNNKRRFEDFIKLNRTPDVTNIYCFDDAIGIDADYMFAFNCNSETSARIIAAHNLTMDTTNSGNAFGLQDDFEWWDKDRIAKLTKYNWTDGDQYFKYYWYDDDHQKAYFFDFDM